MKSRFTTFDIKAIVHELQQRLAGLRVVNVYDIDTKTYLIKLAKTDEKAVLLLESGIRLHTTEFEWPKNIMPSGFAMKMRKHLKGRRLEKVEQLGVDRIVDLQFGSSEAAYHVILELYDRGNIILTDHEYTILNIQRPRTDDSQDVRFAVRERYPVELAKKHEGPMTMESLMSVLMAAQEGDNLKKILNPHLVYGGSLIEHSLLLVGLNINARLGHDFKIAEDASRLLEALHQAETIMANINVETSQGYIIQQKEKKAVVADVGENEVLMTYSEFHPYLFKQHEHQPNVPFSFFDRAVDEFFSKIESQKQDRKLIQQEKTALKKLDGIKNEHIKRLDALKTGQEVDTRKAKFIEMNLPMVDRAITVIRSALANQIDWPEIEQMIEEATQQGDVVASSIKSLKLDTNHFTMLLKVPTDSDDESDDADSHEALKPLKVDIDLGLSAYANARKYYDMKRHAAVKEQKTVDATEKAMKSAERKTKMTLKEVRMVATINKARKTFWFEKFLWFISSENYIVIGGRDQQQNEIIVKRYLKPGDLYVHADLHGASSIVIKNPSKEPVPPKTLNEAGTMALCYSAAWDAKVVTSSWWVYHDQVSKTAPSGEYLTTGSFMIRGKKNYLPPSHLIYGFGFLFKADESCVFRHKNERRVRTIEEEEVFSVTDSANDVELKDSVNDDLCSVDEEEEEKPEGNNVSSDSEAEERKADEKKDDLAQDESEEDQDDGGDDGEAAGEKEIPDAASHVENEICDFPDTSIQLHHVKGGEFRLTKEISVHDGLSENNSTSVPESQSGCEQDAGPKVARLSAKQRRELKKKKKVGEQSEGVNEEKPEELEELETQAAVNERLETPPTQSENKGGQKEEVETEAAGNERSLASHPTQQSQAKRGQKAKLKKIKEKYGDQDEEERQLKMELLASSRGPKEEKLKKGKKGKQQQQQLKNKQLGANDGKKQGQVKGKPQGRLTILDIRDDKSVFTAHPDGGVAEELGEDKSTAEAAASAKTDDAEADEDGQEGLEEDGGQIMQDADLLNSLTGIPDAEDMLLFSIPVCAPYSAMINYKYRVKLVPGTTRRGKAAKTALNMFLYDKTAVAREKDLLKILKDTDVSRNMPGKVKVSAPNLHKQKHK